MAFDDAPKKPSAPSMERSRGQLASAYAPGAFFTFEGGLGSCIAIPDADSQYHDPHLPGPVQDQIIGRLDEAVSSWFWRAFNCRNADAMHKVKPELCVDASLLNDDRSGVQAIDRGRFIFVDPTHMGYAPAPLTFVCNHCGLFRHFKDISEFKRKKASLTSCKCLSGTGKKCQWRQLDVIFVHWSGHWEPVMPGKYDWDNENHRLREPINRCIQCHSEDFILNTNSPSIGKWFFKCANQSCNHVDNYGWVKNDPETIKVLRDEFPKTPTAAHMEPISYRASSAFYAQSEQFILFDASQGDLLSLLDPSKYNRLADFIAGKFGFGSSRPSLEEIERELKERGYADKWQDFEGKKRVAQTAKELLDAHAAVHGPEMAAGMRPVVDALEKSLDEQVDSWFSGDSPILQERNELPGIVHNLMHIARDYFSSRYDPFRLTVEHKALSEGKLNASGNISGRRPFVRFDALDKDLRPKDDHDCNQQEVLTRSLLNQLGIRTMGLIREFDLCRFTYGYSRVQAVPAFEKRQQMMPVRLNLFPSVQASGGSKHPIYVITQANEAIYVELDPESVYAWLRELNPHDMFEWDPSSGQPLGARLLEHAKPFGHFLDAIKAREESSVYYYVYTLLHSFSHVVMKGIAEHSGLDLGSLGEYIFPVDISFVVYRNGTTMDLGNLSSLWRNENNAFLKHLLEPKTLVCNSGSLCDSNPKNPGACPDCILIPETSCIAMNQLLSRSVLRGGSAPREDGDHLERIPGYLQVVNNAR